MNNENFNRSNLTNRTGTGQNNNHNIPIFNNIQQLKEVVNESFNSFKNLLNIPDWSIESLAEIITNSINILRQIQDVRNDLLNKYLSYLICILTSYKVFSFREAVFYFKWYILIYVGCINKHSK
jgi:hypothetical protein